MSATKEQLELRELQSLLRKFFRYLDTVEESDEGREFHPFQFTCCRALWVEPIGHIMDQLKKRSHTNEENTDKTSQ
jgi:hypothetical protein